jgi:hypothetical protein
VANPWSRDTAFTRFVGVIAPGTVRAYRWPSEVPVEPSSEGTAGSGVTFAQVLRYQVVAGPHAAEIEAASKRRGVPSLYVVPWETDNDFCRRVAWTRSTPPLLGVDTIFVAIAVRPERDWINHVPTADFDMYTSVYPEAAGSYGLAARPPMRPAAASARDFLEVYENLPTAEGWNCSPQAAYDAFQAWLRDHPALADRYPIGDILPSLHEVVLRAKRFPRGEGCPR